jgi:hypothetical protein
MGKMNFNGDFESLIRSKLEDCRTEVAQHNWTAIEKSLLKRKRTRFLYFVTTSVAAAAVVAFVAVTAVNNAVKSNRTPVETVQTDTPDNDAASTTDSVVAKPAPAPLVAEHTQQSASRNTEKIRKHTTQKTENNNTNNTNEPVETQELQEPQSITVYDGDKKYTLNPISTERNLRDLSVSNITEAPLNRLPLNRLPLENSLKNVNANLAIPGNDATPTTTQNNSEIREKFRKFVNNDWALSVALNTSNYQNQGNSYGSTYSNTPLLTLNETGSYVKNRHRDEIHVPDNAQTEFGVPLSAKIAARKNLSSKWAVETGLSYTYLSTTYKWGQSNQNFAKQQLHYAGISASAVYYAFTNAGWNVYASAGTTVEKGVYGFVHHNSASDAKIPFHGLQYSVNAAIGINYKLNQKLGLFFEPQAGYFFNTNQPESIRTSSPISIGLGAGLRFMLK